MALRRVGKSLTAFIENYVCPKFALESLAREGGPTWTTTV